MNWERILCIAGLVLCALSAPLIVMGKVMEQEGDTLDTFGIPEWYIYPCQVGLFLGVMCLLGWIAVAIVNYVK